MRDDSYSFEYNTADGRKRNMRFLGYGVCAAIKLQQLEFNLNLPSSVDPDDLVLARDSNRYFFVSRDSDLSCRSIDRD